MVPRTPAPRRPAIALLVLMTLGARARADDPVPPAATPTEPAAMARQALTLGAPIPPARTGSCDAAVGLRSLDANGATVAALRSDGRVLVEADGRTRVVEPPAGGEAFRAPIVAGDGVPVAVTTRGRIAVLEPSGTRFLPCAIQRSAKPVAIPGSSDVLLGSENGSIRRLVRTGAEPRLDDIVERGDEPVGTLAASADRVVYARLDGVVLSAPLAGRTPGIGPTVLARPTRAVRAIRFVGATPFAAIGAEFVSLEDEKPANPMHSNGASDAADIDAVALTADGDLVALLAAGVIEVRRTSDGTRVRSDALRARRPTALAWSRDARTLWVATASDGGPFAIPIRRDEQTPTAKSATPPSR